MDTTFYEEPRFRKDEMRGMKRPMTLDLDSSGKSSKKPRGVNTLLTSPDLNMLKLASPELEKLIIAHNSSLQGETWKTSNPCMYPKNDEYTREFNDALSSLQQVTSTSNLNNVALYQPQQNMDMQNLVNVSNCNMMPQIPCSTTMVDSYGYHQQQPLSSINMNCNPMVSSTAVSSMNTNCYPPNGGYFEPLVNIKEEPQTVPCMGLSPPPHSPIDMEDQERLKLERKRLRNRIAASKCRRRKLERIARLEDKVANLKSENADLVNHVARLRDCICQLKTQVMEHVRSGCEILVNNSFATEMPH